MIEIYLESKRAAKPVTILPPAKLPWVPQTPANEIVEENKFKNSSFALEKLRRDRIVREAFEKCKWKVGDFVMPYNETARREWGTKCRVVGIAKNLIDYGEKDWPADDTPLIILAKIEGTNKSFFCTPAYLVPYEEKATS